MTRGHNRTLFLNAGTPDWMFPLVGVSQTLGHPPSHTVMPGAAQGLDRPYWHRFLYA